MPDSYRQIVTLTLSQTPSPLRTNHHPIGSYSLATASHTLSLDDAPQILLSPPARFATPGALSDNRDKDQSHASCEQELPVSPASIERDASLTFHPEPIGPHNTTDARSMERRVAGGCHGCRSIESVRTGKQPSLIPLCYSAHSQSRHACYIPGHGQLGATDERSFRHSTRPHSS